MDDSVQSLRLEESAGAWAQRGVALTSGSREDEAQIKETEPRLGEQGLQSKEGKNGKRVSVAMLAPLAFLSGQSNGDRTLPASLLMFHRRRSNALNLHFPNTLLVR